VTDAFSISIHLASLQGTAVVIGHVQNRSVLDILHAGEKEMAANGVRLVRLEQIVGATRVAGGDRDRMGAHSF
jgi:polysaccharide deacetylase 2 family uncharacterized protein YibQ